MQKKYEYVDKRLNKVYDKALESIENTEKSKYFNFTEKKKDEWKKTLREVQREWVSFKEKECKKLVVYEKWGGSGIDAFIRKCLIRKTMNRIKQLKERYYID